MKNPYTTYCLAFDSCLRAARGLPVADKATKIEGLTALIEWIDAEVASGRGAYCSVTLSWDGGEPCRTLSAAERRKKAVADLAAINAGREIHEGRAQQNANQ
jgi:hypothetical protein